MEIKEVANRLVELCREGKYTQAHQELYSPNVVSLEPEGTPNQRVEGMEGLAQRTAAMQGMIKELHGGYTTDPIIAGNKFSVGMGMDVTMHNDMRVNMEEICVYTVKDGKITKEEFIYDVMPQEAHA